MGQPIYCAAPACEAEADVIIGDTHSGDQTPLCYPHLYGWCEGFIRSVDDAEIEQTDAEAEARISAVTAPPQSRGNDSFDAEPEPKPAELPVEPFPATAKIVRKHTSKSRRTYEARKAARESKAAAGATIGQNVSPEPSDGPTEANGGIE